MNTSTDKSKEQIIESTQSMNELSKRNVSEGSINYLLRTDYNNPKPVYPVDPSFRIQRMGVSLDIDRPLVDTDSSLLNITKPSSGDYINKLEPLPKLTNLTDGNYYQEYTRLVNPPLDIKGMGLNRFYHVHNNPQINCIEPWNSRIGEDTVNDYLDHFDTCNNCR
jgi:hypothetical protein